MVSMRNYLDLVTVGYPTHWLLHLLCVLFIVTETQDTDCA